MKEYGIYIRCNGGTPYMIHIYDNLYSAKTKLYEMVNLEEERERPYFVDNDFFENKYNLAVKLKYFCIKEREVSEWIQYSKENEERQENNNIIFLKNYK